MSLFICMGILFVLLICGMFGGAITYRAGHSTSTGFVLGILFGPLGILIAAVFALQSPNTAINSATVTDMQDRRPCPYCAEMIMREAVVCRFCGRDVKQIPAPNTSTQPTQPVKQIFSDIPDELPSPNKTTTRAIVPIIVIVIIVFLFIMGFVFNSVEHNIPPSPTRPSSSISSAYSLSQSVYVQATATATQKISYTPIPTSLSCTITPQRITAPSSPYDGGTMTPGCSKSFVINVQSGQVIALGRGYDASNSIVTMASVQDPNGQTLQGEVAAGTAYYPAYKSGDYTITFTGTGPLIFGISVEKNPDAQQVTAPTSAKRITFAKGAISATVQGTTNNVDTDHWVISVLSGQTMTLNLIAPNGKRGSILVFGADGTPRSIGAMQWSGKLPKTQDYYIDVIPETGAMSYTLQVNIPPAR